MKKNSMQSKSPSPQWFLYLSHCLEVSSREPEIFSIMKTKWPRTFSQWVRLLLSHQYELIYPRFGVEWFEQTGWTLPHGLLDSFQCRTKASLSAVNVTGMRAGNQSAVAGKSLLNFSVSLLLGPLDGEVELSERVSHARKNFLWLCEVAGKSGTFIYTHLLQWKWLWTK